jgi:hypothetical protein
MVSTQDTVTWRRRSGDIVRAAGHANRSRRRLRLWRSRGGDSRQSHNGIDPSYQNICNRAFQDETLHTVRRIYQTVGIAIVIDEEDLLSEEASGRELSERAQTYIWWRFVMAPYRGKWNDMHKLASTWKMSPAASVRNFRTAVDRMCKRPSVIVYPFGKAWDSVLSEDS